MGGGKTVSDCECFFRRLYVIVLGVLLFLMSLMLMGIRVDADIASGTSGTCSWVVDDNGVLTIRPTNGTSGQLASYTSGNGPFYSYRNQITKVVVENGVKTRAGCYRLFRQLSNCTEINLSGLDTSAATTMQQMFSGCSGLTSLDVSSFETENVTTMQSMFSGCSGLTSLDVSGFDTGKVTNMNSMFVNCSCLTSLNLSGFNTSKVTFMGSMFYGCSGLTSLELSGLNTEKVTNMSSMFQNCSSLTSIAAHELDTSNVTRIDGMFYGCSNLVSLDLSGFDTSKVTLMGSMFCDCSSLTSLDASGLDTSNVTNMYRMFFCCSSLISLDISNFNMEIVTKMDDMFFGCSSLASINLGESFSFKGNGSTYQTTLPSPPTNVVYTGKWNRNDEVYGPYDSNVLAENYNSTMAGTWVWQEKLTTYTINYTAPPFAAGSMLPQKIKAAETGTLAPNAFYRFNYYFDHWDGSDGKTYTDKQTIPANTFQVGDTLTLIAVLVKNENNVNIDNGEFDLILHTNEKASFTDFPGGATYTIYEETPSGWQLINQIIPSGTMPANGSAEAQFTNEYAPGNTTVQLIATKTLDGNTPPNNAYTFELLNADNEVIETKTNDASGMILFSPISISTTGDKIYYIREIRGDDPGINYDSHIETVTIHVADDGAGNLTATPEYDSDGAKFENYTKPGMMTVTKETDGNGTGDETFTFEIKLTDEYNTSLEDIDIITPAA